MSDENNNKNKNLTGEERARDRGDAEYFVLVTPGPSPAKIPGLFGTPDEDDSDVVETVIATGEFNQPKTKKEK